MDDRMAQWSVNIPLSDLQKLLDYLGTQDRIIQDNEQLRREVEGLRDMFRDLMDEFREVRRDCQNK